MDAPYPEGGAPEPRDALVAAIRESRGRERVQFANAPRSIPVDAQVDDRYDKRQIALEGLPDDQLEAEVAKLPVRTCAEMAFHVLLRIRDPQADIETAIALDIPVYAAGILPIEDVAPPLEAKLAAGHPARRPFAVFRGRQTALPERLRRHLQPPPRGRRASGR